MVKTPALYAVLCDLSYFGGPQEYVMGYFKTEIEAFQVKEVCDEHIGENVSYSVSPVHITSFSEFVRNNSATFSRLIQEDAR